MMRCFYACFSYGHHPKRSRYLVDAKPSKELRYQNRGTLQLLLNEEPIKVNEGYKEKNLEEKLSSHGRRKVKFNLSVENKEALPSSMEEVIEKEKDAKESNEIGSIESACHPLQACTNGEECEGLESMIQEESSESLFSLSIDSRKQCWGGADMGEKEVTSSMPKCGSSSPTISNALKETGSNRNPQNGSKNVDCALSQIENLVQLRPVKTRIVLPFNHQDKENVVADPNVKPLARCSKGNANKEELVDQENAVDTSLSSWLVGSGTTPMSNSSPNSTGNSSSGKRNFNLSTEETKQVCGSNSLGGSRSQSYVELVVIGTVGSYWRHTGQMVDSYSGSSGQEVTRSRSKVGEDETREKWNPTKFEDKLSAALEVGVGHV